jgi:hypothetical protein
VAGVVVLFVITLGVLDLLPADETHNRVPAVPAFLRA